VANLYAFSNHDFPRHISRYSREGDPDARARVVRSDAPSLFAARPFTTARNRDDACRRKFPEGRNSIQSAATDARSPIRGPPNHHGGFSTNDATWHHAATHRGQRGAPA